MTNSPPLLVHRSLQPPNQHGAFPLCIQHLRKRRMKKMKFELFAFSFAKGARSPDYIDKNKLTPLVGLQLRPWRIKKLQLAPFTLLLQKQTLTKKTLQNIKFRNKLHWVVFLLSSIRRRLLSDRQSANQFIRPPISPIQIIERTPNNGKLQDFLGRRPSAVGSKIWPHNLP